jgi:putative FmdB family regulatory protein
MPIYVYKCESCGYAKDVLQKMSDAPLTDCPTCGAASFKKQLTSAGFQLKGSGWYATDFKGTAASALASGEGGGSDSDSSDSAAAKPAPSSTTPAATPPAPATVAATASAVGGGGSGEACACH